MEDESNAYSENEEYYSSENLAFVDEEFEKAKDSTKDIHGGFKGFRETEMHPVTNLRDAILDSVKAMDHLILDLMDAAERQEQQRMSFEQSILESFQSVMEEEEKYNHMSTKNIMQFLTNTFGDAKHLIEGKMRRTDTVENKLMMNVLEKTGPEGSIELHTNAWSQAFDAFLAAQYQRSSDTYQKETFEKIMSLQPDVQGIMKDIISEYKRVDKKSKKKQKELSLKNLEKKKNII